MEYAIENRDIVKKAKLKSKITNKNKNIKGLQEGLLTNYIEKVFNNSTIKFENLYVILYDKVATLIKDWAFNKTGLIKYKGKGWLSNGIRFDFG